MGRGIQNSEFRMKNTVWLRYTQTEMRRAIFLLALMAASAFAIEIPRKSPEFVIELPGDKQLLVSQYRGKVLCLVFILTT
jgi:hypothetical protein